MGNEMHVIKPRAYGIETEYACVLARDGEDIPISQWPANFLKRSLYYLAKNECIATSDGRVWHPNGSLTYVDIGEHPEHATAECRSVRDVVIYSQAGDRLVRDLLIRAAHDEGMDIFLFKNNIAAAAQEEYIVTFGCHENYMLHHVDCSIYRSALFASFIASRQIFAGSGYFDDYGVFYLSGRAYALGMKSVIGSEAIPIQIKDENMKPRFHLTYGDSSLLDVAEFLKVGTMSLMIELIEARKVPDIMCKYPKKDFWDIARYGAKTLFPLCSGGLISALEVQVRCFDAARRMVLESGFESPETKAEMELVLTLWEQVLNAIEHNDIAWMLGRIDWATKKWLVDRELKKIGEAERVYGKQEVAKRINILYHSIMQSGVRDRIYARFPERRITSDAEIDAAREHAPQGTRAQYRSAIVRMTVARCLQPAIVIDWHAATLRNGINLYNFSMNDPLLTYEELSLSTEEEFNIWHSSDLTLFHDL